jgi:hypothetical protein
MRSRTTGGSGPGGGSRAGIWHLTIVAAALALGLEFTGASVRGTSDVEPRALELPPPTSPSSPMVGTPAPSSSGATVSASPSAPESAATTTSSPPTSVWDLPSTSSPRSPDTIPPKSSRALPLAPARERTVAEQSDELEAQLAALERVRDRLRHDDGGRAMELLEKFDQRFPRPLVRDEATVLRLQVLLALGRRSEATALGDGFVATHPNSLYRARIAQLLEGKRP